MVVDGAAYRDHAAGSAGRIWVFGPGGAGADSSSTLVLAPAADRAGDDMVVRGLVVLGPATGHAMVAVAAAELALLIAERVWPQDGFSIRADDAGGGLATDFSRAADWDLA